MEVTIDPTDDTAPSTDDGVDGAARSPAESAPARRERIRVRNHDHDRTYRVTLTARPVSDGTVPPARRSQLTDGVRTTYAIGPGDVTCDGDALPPGVYDVVARTDAGASDRARCYVDDDPAATVVVGVGNGIVSVCGTRPTR